MDPRDYDLIDLFEVIEPEGFVRRCVGEKLEPTDFYVYCPKVILVRRTVPFSNKCIELISEPAPKSSDYTGRRHFIRYDDELEGLRRKILRSTVFNWQQVFESYESLHQDKKLFGRRFDLWRPLLAVCKVYFPKRYDDLLSLAYEDAERAEEGDFTSDVEDALLAYFRLCEEKSATYLLKDLTEEMSKRLGAQLIRSYHIVNSALKNLGIINYKRSTTGGVKIQVDLDKAHALADERKIEKTTTPEPIQSVQKTLPTTDEEDQGVIGVCSLCGADNVVVYHGVCDKCRKQTADENAETFKKIVDGGEAK